MGRSGPWGPFVVLDLAVRGWGHQRSGIAAVAVAAGGSVPAWPFQGKASAFRVVASASETVQVGMAHAGSGPGGQAERKTVAFAAYFGGTQAGLVSLPCPGASF